MSLCRQCQRDPDEYDRFLRKQGDQLNALRAELTEVQRERDVARGIIASMGDDYYNDHHRRHHEEEDKLRAELADLQRDRDELARQAEAAAEVNRQLDAELAEAKRERDEFGAAFKRVTEQVCGDAGWQCAARFGIELAEANARVAELVVAATAAAKLLINDTRESNATIQAGAALRTAIAKAEAAKEPR